MPAEFHFLRPAWLLALIPLALVLWLVRRPLDAGSAWQRVCDDHLLPFLLVVRGGGESRLPLLLLGAGWLIAVLALAGPTWAKRPQPVLQTLDARVIVLDLSRSMAATDLKPSRLERARFKVADILRRSGEGQTGLVAFAGKAFTVSPLTQDADTIAAFLPALTPDIMPVQGSRADLGLQRAAELLRQAGLSRGEILLIADGMNGPRALDAAQALRVEGFRVSVLAVGTKEGAPVPAGDGGFLKDGSGNIVVPSLNEDALRELARAGGGGYAGISTDSADLDFLMDNISAGLGTQTRRTDRETDAWREEGPWLVLLLVPLAALAFRRGWLLLVIVLVGTAPEPSWAFGWNDLWARPDQQAARALAQGNAARAEALAEDPLLRGTAAYRNGQYERALESFAEASGADADYNRGNTLAQLGQLEDAIAAYDAALAKKPEMEDAKVNRATIEKLLRQQQSQQSSSSGQSKNGEQKQEQQAQENAADGQQNQGRQQGDEQQDGERESASGEQAGSEGEKQQSAQPGEEQQAKEEGERQAAAKPAPGESEQDKSGTRQQPAQTDDPAATERQQVVEQWLRRIPDDPGGLLRRKFLYQYRRAGGGAETGEAW